MNLLDALSQAQNGQALNNLASQFGLPPDQVQQAVSALIPHLVAGMKGQSGGLDAVIGMLSGGDHAAVANQPSQAFGDAGVTLGKQVLGQIFGSTDVSHAVASNVAQQTGVSADTLKQMLPMVTTMVMGALATHTANAAPASGGGLGGLIGGLVGGGQPAAGGSSLSSMLGSVLDANHDGNVADDLMKLAGGFLSRR